MYSDNPPRGGRLIAIYGSLFGVATLVVAVRLFARTRRGFQWSTDDGLIVLAWMGIAGILACSIIGTVRGGWGYHLPELTLPEIKEGLKQEYIFEIIYNPVMMFIKLSILFFYRRINPEKRFRMVVYIFMGIVICAATAPFLAFIFQCRPVRYFWDRTIPGGSCQLGNDAIIVNAIINMVLDVCILLIPIPMVWKLRISQRQKIALSAVFMVGLFTCIASGIRTYYLRHVVTPDPLYDGTYPGIWTYVELVSAIVCASLPALRSLVTDVRRKSTTYGKKDKPSDYFSWSRSSNSRHRRLQNGDLDGTGSNRELTSDIETGKDLGVDGSTITGETLVLQSIHRQPSAVTSRTTAGGPTVMGGGGGRSDGGGEDQIGLSQDGVRLSPPPPARIQVDTSISVYNSAKV